MTIHYSPQSQTPKPNPDPPCTDCPHSAGDHNGDGWGDDDEGSFDWFLCPVEDCGCRVKGYLYIKHPGYPVATSTAAV